MSAWFAILSSGREGNVVLLNQGLPVSLVCPVKMSLVFAEVLTVIVCLSSRCVIPTEDVWVQCGCSAGAVRVKVVGPVGV